MEGQVGLPWWWLAARDCRAGSPHYLIMLAPQCRREGIDFDRHPVHPTSRPSPGASPPTNTLSWFSKHNVSGTKLVRSQQRHYPPQRLVSNGCNLGGKHGHCSGLPSRRATSTRLRSRPNVPVSGAPAMALLPFVSLDEGYHVLS